MGDKQQYQDIREAVSKLCAQFAGEYWREKDRTRSYPTEFVNELTDAGYLAVLIPEEYGGSGLGLSAACAVMEEIQRSGANGAACHAQTYTMMSVVTAISSQEFLCSVRMGDICSGIAYCNSLPRSAR